jgi:hypothetical protein
MFVVPLKGDSVETKDGVKFTVLSYTNYREKGPAVYVEHTKDIPSDAVYFFDIAKINGMTVEFAKGLKVFKSLGKIDRKLQLPQPADIVTYRSDDGAKSAKVVNIRLHKRGELAKGLQIECQNDAEEKFFLRIDKIIDIERDIGNDMFSRDKFLSLYDDYRGSR